MNTALEIGAIFSFLAFASIVFLVLRHAAMMRTSNSEIPGYAIGDRYRPMLRLLADDDFRFLKDGGWSSGAIRRLRAERRRLFRTYLRSLVKDYSRVLAGLRHVMAESHVDRPDLARALVVSRFSLFVALFQIEVRLALNAAGVTTVDASGLVQAVESLRQATASLQMAVAPMPVS